MIDEESRKAFEATISAAPYEKSIDRYPQESTAWPGNYIDYPVHLAHDLWQAAVKWATKRERERCVDMVEFVKAHAEDVGEFEWIVGLINQEPTP